MAAIQNDRDILLQAASVRVIVVPNPDLDAVMDATRGVKLSATSNVFQISASGIASPASIVLTAELALLPPSTTVTWSFAEGTGSLTGTGLTRTLNAVSMITKSVTIQVQAQAYPGAPIFAAYWTIVKTSDGTNGTNGSNGTSGYDGARGSLTAYASLSNLVAYSSRLSGKARWAAGSASEANAVTADNMARNSIWWALGYGGSASSNNHLRIGDTVTLTNSGQTVSATGYWTGSSWANPGAVLDGNLLVGGNITGQEFSGGVFTGTQFRTAVSGSRAQIDSYGGAAHMLRLYEGANVVVELSNSGISANVSDENKPPGRFSNLTGNALSGTTQANNKIGVYGLSVNGNGGVGTYGESNSGIGIFGSSASGTGAVFQSNLGPAMRLMPTTSFSSNRLAGNICYHSTYGLCFANGTNWLNFNGTVMA